MRPASARVSAVRRQARPHGGQLTEAPSPQRLAPRQGHERLRRAAVLFPVLVVLWTDSTEVHGERGIPVAKAVGVGDTRHVRRQRGVDVAADGHHAREGEPRRLRHEPAPVLPEVVVDVDRLADRDTQVPPRPLVEPDGSLGPRRRRHRRARHVTHVAQRPLPEVRRDDRRCTALPCPVPGSRWRGTRGRPMRTVPPRARRRTPREPLVARAGRARSRRPRRRLPRPGAPAVPRPRRRAAREAPRRAASIRPPGRARDQDGVGTAWLRELALQRARSARRRSRRRPDRGAARTRRGASASAMPLHVEPDGPSVVLAATEQALTRERHARCRCAAAEHRQGSRRVAPRAARRPPPRGRRSPRGTGNP